MALREIQLPLSVPREQPGRDRSIAQITQRLRARRGIHDVHIASDPDLPDHPTHHHVRVDLTYDTNAIALSELNGDLREAGRGFADTIGHLVMPVIGLTSPRHEQAVEASLNRLPGVLASASYAAKSVRIEFDRRHCALPEIVRRLERLGITLRQQGDRATATPSGADSPRPLWRLALAEWDVRLTLMAGVCLLAGFLVHALGGPSIARFILVGAAFILGGWFPGWALWRTVRAWRLDIDVLMFAAAFGAASLGHYEEGALLLFLFSLGGAGERLALNRARGAIEALADLAPRVATRIEPDGRTREIPVEDLAIGDRVLVRPAERAPADGEVIEGASTMDQSPITGESTPVEKVVGDAVFAGAINGDGGMTIQVSRASADNTISKVIRLVEQAQTTRSPTERFTDRVERWYVPMVIVGTIGVAAIPPMLGLTPGRDSASIWQGWFYQAMAFLTAASPCALAIGTPAAMLSGIARAARAGVLVKGGGHLETLGRVRAIAFDKTGTLTRGRPVVSDVAPLTDDLDEAALLALAAGLEAMSGHPLALAIVDEAQARECAPVEAVDVDQQAGLGMRGRVGGRTISVGRLSMFSQAVEGHAQALETAADLERQGRTVVAVGDDRRVLGLIALTDQPRPGAAAMIASLRNLGIRHMVMLTGDNLRSAEAVASQVGVDAYQGELMPEDKFEAIRQLDRDWGKAAMIGDGVNDAPALAAASVGVAIGGAGGGTDLALETADIALLSDDLAKLPQAVSISRFTRRVVIQNLVLALSVIVILAPLAALGWTPISLAVLFHEGSTVLVVLNALRILAHQPSP